MANKSLKLGNNDRQMPAKKAKVDKKNSRWDNKKPVKKGDPETLPSDATVPEPQSQNVPDMVPETPSEQGRVVTEPILEQVQDTDTDDSQPAIITTAGTELHYPVTDTGMEPVAGQGTDSPNTVTAETEPAADHPKRHYRQQTETTDLKPKKLSLINAAYQVLQTRNEPLTCSEIIDVLNTEGIWSSPKGKTPANTLYSSLLREIKTKEGESRFQRIGSGKFTIRK